MIGQRKSDPGTNRFALWILAALLGAGIWMQTQQMRGIESHLDQLQATVAQAQRHQLSLQEEVGEMCQGLEVLETGQGKLGTGLAALNAELGAVREEAAYARALAERLDETEGQLGAIGATVEAQAGCLKDLEEAQASFGPSDLAAELAARDARLSEQYESLNALVSRAEAKADESRQRIDDLGAEMNASRDLKQMWRELMGPVVQLAGDASVGSGVLLESRFDPDRDAYSTYLLTAWHVVRDIQGGSSHRDVPVPVAIYDENGATRNEEAHLICFDTEIDAALLELRTDDKLQHGARLPRRSDLASVRIFDEVYAVGCPLGNDPIPTRGEILTSHHMVDDERYWMINAPTYIGNSGGGIFHSETHELLGIFSKIYTHGSVRPTIVPHMGLATPLDTIYTWLETEGYDLIEPTVASESAYLAAAGS